MGWVSWGEIIIVCDDLLLLDPELPAELVDLRLQRSDAGLKLGKLGLGLSRAIFSPCLDHRR